MWDLFQRYKGGSTFTKLITVMYHINKTRDKNYMVISILKEKLFCKNILSFMIKTANQWRIEGTLLNMLKPIYDKLWDNLIHIDERVQVFFLRSGTKVYTLSPFLQHSNFYPLAKKKK